MFARLKQWFKRKVEDHLLEVSPEQIPRHVAIIMDGNGRWANSRGLPRVLGHRRGVSVIKDTAILADKLGIEYLTLYSFSTENWKRPKHEVEFLMSLPREFLIKELDELIEKNVKIQMIGFREDLPQDTLNAVDEAVEKTKYNTGLTLSFAFNYGSRKEMTYAMKRMYEDLTSENLKSDSITDDTFSRYLMTFPMPDPDLLIRTSGELRISNFLMWQLAYSELWFTDVFWPDFNERHFCEAIAGYQRRIRRYGALK